MKKIVVFTGAGISADSGLATFRDADGLWANYRIEEVCTPEALETNRAKVVEFYNLRRQELLNTRPNPAHYAIARLEEKFEVEVITQNVDDLHEEAGSSKVCHLHGELKCLRSSYSSDKIYPIPDWRKNPDCWRQDPDARDEQNHLLRPHIVFFGEAVPEFDRACKIASTADIFMVVGTSLAVYPAAYLIHYVPEHCKVYIVDPKIPEVSKKVVCIQERAAKGVPVLVEQLMQQD